MAMAGWTRAEMLIRYTRAQAANEPPSRPAVSTSETSEAGG